MAYTYEELNKMNITDLRKFADGIDHEAVHGHLTMHKEKLVPAICIALGIEAHAHHHVVGLDKRAVKLEIRSLKKQRDKAAAGKEYKQLGEIRQRIHDLKGKLRRSSA